MHLVAEAVDVPWRELVALGIGQTTAKHLARLAHVYYGKTAFTRYQARCREAAAGHGLAALVRIETHARKAHRMAGAKAEWTLRESLCAASGEQEIDALGQQLIEELARGHRPAGPEPGVKVYRRAGNWTLAITGKDSQIAPMWQLIRESAGKEAVGQALVDAAYAELCGTGNAGGVTRVLNSTVVVQVPALARIAQGAGGDVTLHLTDGTSMSGSEYIRATLGEEYFALLGPTGEPVNLYRDKRGASWVQRKLLESKQRCCAWKGCRKPASECQVHHIHGWVKGGLTNLDNLVLMCPYHNALCELPPGHPGYRGHVVKIDGAPAWISPRGGPPVFAEPP